MPTPDRCKKDATGFLEPAPSKVGKMVENNQQGDRKRKSLRICRGRKYCRMVNVKG